MTALASDDFVDVASDIVTGRTLNNALGGSGSRTWAGASGVQALSGNGSGALVSNSANAASFVTISGATKASVRVNPNGAENNLILWGRRDLLGNGSATGVALLFAASASLRVSEFDAGTRTDHATLSVTPPTTNYWMEIEVNGLTVTCRILNNDTSVRNTVSHTFSGSVPSGGNNWGFGFFQNGSEAIFEDFVADDGGASDTENPGLTGALTVVNKTSSTIDISWPAGSDNVGVTSYEVSSNGGASWTDVGNVLAHTFTGLAPLTSYDLSVRAKDAAGNTSTPPLALTTSTYRDGALASTILLLTGPQGGNPAGFLYDFASTVATSAWLSYTIVSGPTPAGGSLDANAMGAFSYTGPAPATMVIQPEVNGASAPETITVTLYDNSVSLGSAPMASTPTYGSGPVSQAAPVPLTGTAVAVASAYGSGQIAQGAPVVLAGAAFAVIPAMGAGGLVQGVPVALSATPFTVIPVFSAGALSQAAPVALMGAALSVSTAYGPGAISDAPTFTSLAPSPVCATYRRDSYPAHTFQKLAGETLDFDIDFRYELRSTQDSARTNDPVEIQAGQGVDVLGAYWVPGLRRVKMWITGGEAQGKSDISIWLNTAAGRRLQVDVRVQIK